MWKVLSFLLVLLLCYEVRSAEFVRVGVVPGMPFARLDGEGNRGIVLDIWKRVAQSNQLSYELFPYNENVNAALGDLENGKIDILIGPISTTHEREKIVDFTRPFFLNQIGIVFRDDRSIFSIVAVEILSGDLGILTLLMFVFIFIFACLLLWGRRKDLPKRSLKERLIDETWESATMLVAQTMGEAKMNVTVRLIAFVGLVFGVGFISFFTSVLTSKLTVENLAAAKQRYSSIYELNDAHLIAVKGRTTVEYARKFAGKVTLVSNLNEAMEAVARGQADGVVEDYAIAAESVNKWKGETKLMMSNLILGYDEYAFALSKYSHLRRKIDSTITELQDSGAAKEICVPYIKNLSDLCEL